MGVSTVSCHWLFNSLQRDNLTLDLRCKLKYDESHWVRAQCLDIQLKKTKRAQQQVGQPDSLNLDLFAEQWQTVVVYGDDEQAAEWQGMDHADLVKEMTQIVDSLPLWRPPVEIMVLRQGFAKVESVYPYLCTAHVECDPYLVYPQRVDVPDSDDTSHLTMEARDKLESLFIGGQICAHNLTVLRHLEVRLVVNATKEVPNKFEGTEADIVYHRVPVVDSVETDLLVHVAETLAVIDEAVASGHNVLIHCAQGKSRSATLLIAYMMQTGPLNLTTASRVAKQSRDIVCPNPAFASQLQALESTLPEKT